MGDDPMRLLMDSCPCRGSSDTRSGPLCCVFPHRILFVLYAIAETHSLLNFLVLCRML